jgi:hypothetical protein
MREPLLLSYASWDAPLYQGVLQGRGSSAGVTRVAPMRRESLGARWVHTEASDLADDPSR